MHAAIAAGAGFLAAILWMDLIFDVQARRGSHDDLASIAAYYRRATTEARGMARLISIVMLATLAAIVLQVVQGAAAPWVGWASLALAVSAIGLAGARIVPNARRLGRAEDPPAMQSHLARSVLRDHLYCLAAMALVLALQVTAGLTRL
jgi:hypothetical protein